MLYLKMLKKFLKFAYFKITGLKKDLQELLVGRIGFEPMTLGLKGRCSTVLS